MNSPIVKVRDEGNCARVTEGGEEACECARKHRPVFAADRIHVQAARLRTETAYKAGSARRVSTTSRSRSQITDLVNDELAQRNITLLSGEICQTACESSFAPTSKACLKGWNGPVQIGSGKAEGRKNCALPLISNKNMIRVHDTG